MFARRCAALLTLALLALGCSGGNPRPKTYPVTGTVKYKKGEIPVGALVVFHPKTDAAEKQIGGKPVGKVGEDGTFKLSTYESGDGAPAGEYGITVDWQVAQKEKKFSLGSEGGATTSKLNPKYGNPAAPFKTVTVTTGENKFDLDVD